MEGDVNFFVLGVKETKFRLIKFFMLLALIRQSEAV